jgi:hypothetical protein
MPPLARRFHFLREVLRLVVDRMIGAHRPAEGHLLRAARGREHRRTEGLRELDGREADAARAAMNEERLPA